MIFCKNSTENYLLSVYIASCRKVALISLTINHFCLHFKLSRVENLERRFIPMDVVLELQEVHVETEWEESILGASSCTSSVVACCSGSIGEVNKI